jgi:DNA-binding NarL/FixJ family response regulator
VSDRGGPPPDGGATDGGTPLLVLVVAAYPAVRAGVSALLARDAGLWPTERMPLVGGTGDASLTGEPPPAVVVVDVGSTADAAIEGLEDAYPGVPLVLLGGNPAVDGPGLAAGPIAYLGQDVDGPTLVAAVRGVALGLTVIDPAVAGAGLYAPTPPAPAPPGLGPAPAANGLTVREHQVLALVANGLPNKTIARELGISEHTVKFHVGSLLGKLGAASRTEAVTLATRRGILAV